MNIFIVARANLMQLFAQHYHDSVAAISITQSVIAITAILEEEV